MKQKLPFLSPSFSVHLMYCVDALRHHVLKISPTCTSNQSKDTFIWHYVDKWLDAIHLEVLNLVQDTCEFFSRLDKQCEGDATLDWNGRNSSAAAAPLIFHAGILSLNDSIFSVGKKWGPPQWPAS